MEAITREEMLLSGKPLEPITRKELFLAAAAGMDVQTPEPITREEMFLSMIQGGGGSAPVIEPLSVTENGTYEAPDGVDGYSPVTVNVASSGGEEEWFNDGDTHIWITLSEGRTSPMLGVCPKGTVTVDWGDGTEPDVLTGTSTSTVKWTPTHNYAMPGDYIITLSVDGEMGLSGVNSSSAYSYLLRHDSAGDGRNSAYRNSIIKVEVGDSTSIGTHAFYNCYSLTSVNIPNGVTSIGTHAFYNCYSLTSVIIPNGVTSIGTNAFYYCYSLTSVIIPDSVTSIESTAFYNCYSLTSVIIPDSVTSIGTNAFSGCQRLTSVIIPDSVTSIGTNAFGYCGSVRYYDFTRHTQIPTSTSDAFGSIPADCEIRVPAALYDEWIAATNWSTYASKIVAV